MLGKTLTTGPLPLLISWFATGNNVVLEADTGRACRLEPAHRLDLQLHAEALAHTALHFTRQGE